MRGSSGQEVGEKKGKAGNWFLGYPAHIWGVPDTSLPLLGDFLPLQPPLVDELTEFWGDGAACLCFMPPGQSRSIETLEVKRVRGALQCVPPFVCHVSSLWVALLCFSLCDILRHGNAAGSKRKMVFGPL